ncbi:MAG TPA: peptide ABC transporter permease [Hyphomicrobium sp.]|nr:peptide ABC transporter permease [Hyphomicrobium sp.]
MARTTPDLQNYPAEKARQGEIILKTRTQRIIFIAGLAGMVLIALIATVMGT